MQAFPTPTPAAWASIQQTHAKVQEALDWLSDETVRIIKGGNGQDSAQTGYLRLHQELIKVSSNLVVGHLPNLDLDVFDIMRYITQLSCQQLQLVRQFIPYSQMHASSFSGHNCLATESSPLMSFAVFISFHCQSKSSIVTATKCCVNEPCQRAVVNTNDSSNIHVNTNDSSNNQCNLSTCLEQRVAEQGGRMQGDGNSCQL